MRKPYLVIVAFLLGILICAIFNLFLVKIIVKGIYESHDLYQTVEAIDQKMIDEIRSMINQNVLTKQIQKKIDSIVEQFPIDGIEVFLENEQQYWKSGILGQQVSHKRQDFFDVRRGTLEIVWKVHTLHSLDKDFMTPLTLDKTLQIVSYLLLMLYCIVLLLKILRAKANQNIQIIENYFTDAQTELPEPLKSSLDPIRRELLQLRRLSKQQAKQLKALQKNYFYFRAEYWNTEKVVGQLMSDVLSLTESQEYSQSLIIDMLSDLYLLLFQTWTNRYVHYILQEQYSLQQKFQKFNLVELLSECHAVFENYAKRYQIQITYKQKHLEQEEITADIKVVHHLLITWIFTLLELSIPEKSEMSWGVQTEKEHMILLFSITYPKKYYTFEELKELGQELYSREKLCKTFGGEKLDRMLFFCSMSSFILQILNIENWKVFKEISTLHIEIPLAIIPLKASENQG